MKIIGTYKSPNKIDFGLVDRLNNGEIDVTKTIEKSDQNIESKLMLIDGRPKLELKELKDTFIHVPTQKQYDMLMEVYCAGGWKWPAGNSAIAKEYRYKGKACVDAKDGFQILSIEYYNYFSAKLITDKEFYKIQGITKQDLILIHKHFDVSYLIRT